MPKKCIICGDEAKFCIRDCSEYYCEECAHENFADIDLLEKITERAVKVSLEEGDEGDDDGDEDDGDEDNGDEDPIVFEGN